MSPFDIDILFVHVNASKRIYQDLSKDYSAIEPPIWAGLLANHSRAEGRSVSILDCEAEGLSDTDSANRIHAARPRLIVIPVYGQQPSASAQNMTGVSSLSRVLKESHPEYKIMILGIYPSALPEKCLREEPIDFVCHGEGPDTISALFQTDLSSDTQLQKVPGLSFRSGSEIRTNPASSIIAKEDLDRRLPGMAWDLLPMNRYRTSNWHAFSNGNQKAPFASLYTSLGCPFRCSFCCINAPFGGSSFRHWSPEFILSQFEEIARLGITNIKIADEMFVMKTDHFLRVCELIAERGYRFNIWAYARIDTVKEQYLDTLKKAGVNWLALGIESGVKNVRTDVIKGKFDEVNIAQIVKQIRDHGINVIGNYIFGLPEDTIETMEETLQMAMDLNCEFANFYSCMAYPGSALYKQAVEAGWQLPSEYAAFSQHSYETLPLPTKHISAREVLRFRDSAFDRYYTNPTYLDFLTRKFGIGTRHEIENMTKIKLKRKILE